MQILKGSRKDITVMLWQEQIEKHVKRLNDSMECFRRFHESDDLEHLIEDCEKILENAKHAKTAIEQLDFMGF